MQTCLCARKDRESSFHHCGGPVQLVVACLMPGKIEKAVYTSVEVLRSSCKSIYVAGNIKRAVFTAVVVLSSS